MEDENIKKMLQEIATESAKAGTFLMYPNQIEKEDKHVVLLLEKNNLMLDKLSQQNDYIIELLKLIVRTNEPGFFLYQDADCVLKEIFDPKEQE